MQCVYWMAEQKTGNPVCLFSAFDQTGMMIVRCQTRHLNADLIQQILRHTQSNLGDDIWRGQDRGQYENAQQDIFSLARQHPVIRQPRLGGQEQGHRQKKRYAEGNKKPNMKLTYLSMDSIGVARFSPWIRKKSIASV